MSKNNKKNKLNMNTFNNISKIIVLSAFTIVLIIIIKDINFDSAQDSLGVSEKSMKITIYLVILVSYISLVILPIKDTLNYHVKNKKLPVGDKGSRGSRGKGGNKAQCNICSDDLCDRKVLAGITNAYNYWRKLNDLPLYPDTYIIPNNFIKEKIRKHCKSKKFKKILTKFGSNSACPRELSELGIEKCGSYDYLIKVWTIWTLIILKYKNGAYFLESESLTDNDFAGLIDKEDSYQIGDTVKYTGHQNNFQIIDNKNFPFFKISSTILDAYEKDLTLETPDPSLSNDWDDMFVLDSNNKKGVNQIIISKSKNSDNEVIYTSSGLDDDFFTQKGVPQRGQMSPFDEIKKYNSWYWGRDEITKPKIDIIRTKINSFCNTCFNGVDCNLNSNGSGKIKVIETNSFFHIWKSSNARQETNPFKPFRPLGNVPNSTTDSINILRPYEYIDENEHGYFKRYKPVGDIIIKETEMEEIPQSSACMPENINNSINYQGKKIKRLAIQSVKSILVSGDTQPPTSYQLVTNSNMLRDYGINKNSKGFSIWKPIPPSGYKALGYVISTLPTDNPTQPSVDLIACIPDNSVISSPDNSITQVYTLDKDLNNQSLTSPINFYRNSNIYTFKDNDNTASDDNEKHYHIDVSNNNTICKTYEHIKNENTQCSSITNESDCNNAHGCVYENGVCKEYMQASAKFNDKIKDRKYSILKIYDD